MQTKYCIFKKILIIFSFLFIMHTTVLAASNIIINDVETKDVKNYILERVVMNNSNLIIEQVSDNHIVLLGTRTETSGLFGQYTYTYENRLGFAFIQKGNDVLLSYSETCTSHAPNGEVTVSPVGTPTSELPFLQNIKGYFNGMYTFGFAYSVEKSKGGIPVIEVFPAGAFEKAGIQVGDIISCVNGVKLKEDRQNKTVIGLFFDKTRPTTQSFLIKHGDIEKTYVITSEYVPPQFKKN